MMIPLKYLLYFLLTLTPAVAVITMIVKSNKHILSVLPTYIELDIQFYYTFIAFLFLYNLIFFWKINFFNQLKKSVSILPSLLVIPLLLGIAYISLL